ncbi:trypsin-like peptidase domain-containing protein [Streptomyces sp. 5-8]|uniref:Trypsin-like peptidase domain-containing protein n=1 Tax=Streptomyces musisoli TaxID=2802280 RepID=A0ABS1P155_9ACTN|nr:serine protease [Streptomyces musisoli]MBL1106100.1 trypsin-like peptidase domain-containing protein [Streptomyces musisoli]
MGGGVDHGARVAEVLVRQGGDTEYGSGFLISKSVVLTARHLLRPTTAAAGPYTISVMLGGSEERLPADVAWRSKTQDLALLKLRAPVPGVPLVRFGRLPSAPGTVQVSANGFPRFAHRPERPGLAGRDSFAPAGAVRLGSNLKSGMLDIAITDAPSFPAPEAELWKGMSGAAFFTTEGHFLVGVQHQCRTVTGTNTVEAEPIAGALEDPGFREVLKTDGIRAAKLRPTDVSQAGGEDTLAAVVEQKDLLAGLTGFKRNLISDHLPFVSPGDDHEADPERIMSRILDGDDTGLLLVGSAGTGKTRTGIEVGRVAHEAGWRVLHVRPGGSASLVDEIAKAVLAGSEDVLVVLDYLNLFIADKEGESPLDLEAVKGRLLPDAKKAGIEVVFLASVRPGWLQQHRSRLRSFFGEVHLRQDEEFMRAVTDQGLHHLARTAVDEYGLPRMRRLCGHRPILTLLIASEVERRVVRGLAPPNLAGMREGGELAKWLHARLHEDALTVPAPRSPLDGVHATDDLVAAAAAAAACPQPEAEVREAARVALATTASGAGRADTVVDALIGLGWLEGERGHLEVAHDIVCDQLTDSVIRPDGTRVDKPRTHDLLAGCFTEARTIGRYATNLARLLDDLALRQRDAEVGDVLADWFAGNAAAIGDVMQRDPDVGGYALGAICSGPPWAGALAEHWSEIVAPWLEEYGDTVNARHVLRRGLRHLPTDAAQRLVPTALRWLELHNRRREGSFVLTILLERDEVGARFLPDVLQATVTWLADNSSLAEASHLLAKMLTRRDLTAHQEQRIVAAALRWLGHHKGKREATYVLAPLLDHPALRLNARKAVQAAEQWLREYSTWPEAWRVLAKLLSRDEPTRDARRTAFRHAGEWLGTNGHRQEASHVLGRLLTRGDLTDPELRGAVRSGIGWTRAQPIESNWTYVLELLLKRPDLTDAERATTVRLADEWLEHHVTDTAADFFIRTVLERPDLTPEETRRTVAYADAWLRLHALEHNADRIINFLLTYDGLTADERGMATRYAERRLEGQPHDEENSYALVRLLGQRDVSEEEAAGHVSAALDWLAAHGTGPSASHVVRALLERPHLAHDVMTRTSAVALAWLDHHPNGTGTSFVLGALLSRPDLPAESVPATLSRAMAWLTPNRLEHAAGVVLFNLLLRRDIDRLDLDGEHVRALFDLSFAWLDRHETDVPMSGRVLGSLLFRTDLEPSETERAVSRALPWARRHLDNHWAERTVRALLRREELDEADRRTVVEMATVWAHTHGEHPIAANVLIELLGRTDLTGEQRSRVEAAGSRWVAVNPGSPKIAAVHAARDRAAAAAEAAGSLSEALARLERSNGELPSFDRFRDLLGRRLLTQDAFESIASVVLEWTESHPDSQDSAWHLGFLLSRQRLTGAALDHAFGTAERWLRRHVPAPQASSVLTGVLDRRDLGEDRLRAVLPHVELWLRGHAALEDAQHVLRKLLARHDLAPAEQRKAVGTALRWLESHDGIDQAAHILAPLNASPWLTPRDVSALVEHSLTWMSAERGGRDIQSVLEPLLERSDLTPAQLTKVACRALSWCDGNLGEISAPRLLKVVLCRTEIPGHVSAASVDRAYHWIRPDPTAFDACFFLDALLRVRDLPDDRLTSVVTWSFDWLDTHMPQFKSRLVLRSLLALDHLGRDRARQAADHALTWLRRYEARLVSDPSKGHGQEIVELLLVRTDMNEDAAERARHFATLFGLAG